MEEIKGFGTINCITKTRLRGRTHDHPTLAGRISTLAAVAAFLPVLFGVLLLRNSSQRSMNAPSSPDRLVVVVGSGLAGTVAALSAIEDDSEDTRSSLKVIVFEKEARVGGNSLKASSGINAVNPEASDTEKLFADDVLESGGGNSLPELVKALVDESQDAVEQFLKNKHEVYLNTTLQLGGHRVARTRCPHNGMPVGATIMKRLGRALEDSPKVEVQTSTKVTGLALMKNGKIKVSYETDSNSGENGKIGCDDGREGCKGSVEATAVVLATGGYSANSRLLEKYAPNAAGLPTTNGYFAQGDGLKLGKSVGAAAVQLDAVQLHPTAFVDPKDPDNPVKFLCPERMRGVGGILLNASGSRFVNELARRDVVTSAIRSQPHGGRVFLILGAKAAAEVEGVMTFYVHRGLFRRAETLSQASDIINVSEETLRREFERYDALSEHGDADDFGKDVFPARIDADNGPLYIAEVTPAVHYTMGGLRFDTSGRILNEAGEPIPGVFAVGEVTGGLHGANRLAGNSLLECVVFGRKAGRNAALYGGISSE